MFLFGLRGYVAVIRAKDWKKNGAVDRREGSKKEYLYLFKALI
jgi:hypothetical protein